MLPTVICIDDEAHNNEAISRLLRKNYHVITTESPQEGLQLIETHKPAIIISDQRMPQITGVELLKKSIELSPQSIRLLLTGYTDLESVISAINDGQIYRYLTKPWEPHDLSITIDKSYETYQLRQKLLEQNEILKNLDKLKTDFMILVTHELRTPLTGIVSFLDLLKEELRNKDHKTYLDHIDKNTRRLQRMVEDILLITQLKAQTRKEAAVDVTLKESLETAWNLIADKNKKLNLRINAKENTIVVDSFLWSKLLTKIFANCFQHAVSESSVDVSFANQQNGYLFEVTNSMSQPLSVEPQSLLSAFTKNEKIMNHTQGAGLGLSIVSALTQALGGQLQISAKAKTFSLLIYFPSDFVRNNN